MPAQRQAPSAPPASPAKPRKPRTGWKVTLGVVAGLGVGLMIGGAVTARPTPTTASTAAPATAAPRTVYVTVTAPAPPARTVTVQAPPPAAPVEAPAAAPTGPLTSFSNGTFEVGPDIVAGKYKTPGPSSSGILDSCYMEVGDGSGSISGIDQNDNLTGPGVVTLKKGKVFKTSGGCTWSKVG